MSGVRTVLSWIGVVGFVGVGFGLWAVISPGEDRNEKLIENLPEANPVRMEENRKRNALLLQVLKDAAEINDNIARGHSGQK